MSDEVQTVHHTPEHQTVHHTPRVRRIRRRRKRSLQSRIKRTLKKSGADKKLYIVLAGVAGLVAALYLYDLLFTVFLTK